MENKVNLITKTYTIVINLNVYEEFFHLNLLNEFILRKETIIFIILESKNKEDLCKNFYYNIFRTYQKHDPLFTIEYLNYELYQKELAELINVYENLKRKLTRKKLDSYFYGNDKFYLSGILFIESNTSCLLYLNSHWHY